MRYRLAIFDFDGTLADSFPWFTSVVNGIADRYRFKRIEPHEVDLLRTWSARRIVAHQGVSTWKLPLLAREMRRLVARDAEKIPLFEGVGDMLARLDAAGVHLAIVSSNSEDNVRRVLGPARAAHIRSYDCGASLFGKRRHIRRVLAKSRVPREHAIYVGDEIRDLDSARAERLAFGGVAWGYTRAASLEAHRPDFMFRRVAEIAEVLVDGAA